MKWERRELGTSDQACGLCRSGDVASVQSVEVRAGLNRLRPGWAPAVRSYLRCRACGAKQHQAVLQPA